MARKKLNVEPVNEEKESEGLQEMADDSAGEWTGKPVDGPHTAAAPGDPYADASLEEVFERLEETLSKMDSPDIPLEEAFSLYEQGMKMVAAADGKLKKVEQKLQVIHQEATVSPNG